MKNLIFIIFILYYGAVQAQEINPVVETQSTSTTIQLSSNYLELWRSQFDIVLPDSRLGKQKPSTYLFLNTQNHVTGLFCKMEYKIETKSKLSPRFRLGSVNYTNWMEGKGEYYSRYWK